MDKLEKSTAPDSPEVLSIAESHNEQKQNDAPGFGTYFRIFSFSDSLDWTLNIIGLVAAIASGVALALVNIVFGGFVTTVQDFTQGGDIAHFRSEVSKYALYFVYLGIARLVLVYIYGLCMGIASTRISRTIRYRFLKATLSQNIGFFDEGSYGSVSSQVVTSGNQIQSGLAEKLGMTVSALSAFVAAFVVAFISQWKLTLITMCIVPAIIIVYVITAGLDAKYEAATIGIYGRAGSFAEDVIASMRTVHAFWARPKLVGKFDVFLQEAHDIGSKRSLIYSILFSTEFFMTYAGFALAFWQGLRMYNSGEISAPGTIVTVLFSVVVAATSMTHVAPNILTFTGATSGAATMFKSIDRESEIDSMSDKGLRPDDLDKDITIRNVQFSYPTRPDVQVLKGINLHIPAGKVTALVGASGCGKSTIIGLLERWYDPIAGYIEVGTLPLQALNLKWLRTQVRLVQQEPVLFMGTVFENVKHGLIGTQWENAPLEKQRALVEDACKLANAHDFVAALPKGYDTECGERASHLSGGQKQRIAIARSIVSEPSILLLDEATSALDPHAEGVVQDALDKASKDRTTIVIAHKLATIKNADNIVVMSKGQVIEQGTHTSLLQANGAYAKLVRVQDLGQAVENHEGPTKYNNARSDTESSRTEVVNHSSTIDLTQTTEKSSSQVDRYDFDQHKSVGMVKIVWTLLREQTGLEFCFVLTGLGCLVAGAVYPALALLFANIMEVFTYDESRRAERGNFFALMFFVLALAILFVYGMFGWTTNAVVQAVSHTYRRQLFDLILRQDMQFFDRPENTASAITSRLSSMPQSIMELMGFNLALILVSVVNLIASCALAIVYSWKLGLVVVCAGIPPLAACGWARLRLDLRMQNDNAKRYASSAALAGEAVAAIRTVSSLALEPTVLERFFDVLKGVSRTTIIKTSYLMILFSLTQTIEFFFLALGFWYGCRLLSEGEISLQALYIASVGVFFSGQAASQFFGFSTSINKAKGAANYIFWLRDLEPRIAETAMNEHVGPSDKDHQALELTDINFHYPLRPETKVLKGVSLDINPGQFVALVGASGCGKSTLIAMLERFYDPISGTITLDRTDISRMSPRLYRDLIGLVQQEPTLYQDTIRENIALGITSSERPTDEQIISACKLANAWEFISSLPEGLNTFCGPRGLSLSGGQRQRIAIARALIRNPKIMLLDEATSALDTESERVVQAALTEAAATGSRITVAVAHRLSTIKDADLICVFAGGKIVEAGTHRDLLDSRGIYARMCEAQSLDKAV